MIPKRGIDGGISSYEKEGNERRQKMLEKDKQRKKENSAMTPDERCEYEMKRFIKKWCFELRKRSRGKISYWGIIGMASRRFSDVYLSDILEAYPAQKESTQWEESIRHAMRNESLEKPVQHLWLNGYTCSYCGKDFEQLPNAAFCPHCGKRCGAEECTLDFGDLDKYEFTHKDAEAIEQANYEEANPGWMENKMKLEELLERYEPGTSEHEKITKTLFRHNQLPKMFKVILTTWHYRNLPEKYTQSRRQSVSGGR